MRLHLPHGSTILFPKRLKYVGQHLFGSYEGILTIIFEEGLKDIDLGNILNFAAITTIYLPSTLESIGDAGFGEVNNTEHIYLAEGNKHFCVENGVLYNYDKTKLLRCPVTKRGEFVIPEGVTTISAYAFRLS